MRTIVFIDNEHKENLWNLENNTYIVTGKNVWLEATFKKEYRKLYKEYCNDEDWCEDFFVELDNRLEKYWITVTRADILTHHECFKS